MLRRLVERKAGLTSRRKGGSHLCVGGVPSQVQRVETAKGLPVETVDD